MYNRTNQFSTILEDVEGQVCPHCGQRNALLEVAEVTLALDSKFRFSSSRISMRTEGCMEREIFTVVLGALALCTCNPVRLVNLELSLQPFLHRLLSEEGRKRCWHSGALRR